MKPLLIRLLVRLTDIPQAPKPDTKTEEWLALSWMQDPFRSYLAERERKLREYLSSGVGGQPEPREKYLLAFGQLHELVNFRHLAERCYENVSKRKKGDNQLPSQK